MIDMSKLTHTCRRSSPLIIANGGENKNVQKQKRNFRSQILSVTPQYSNLPLHSIICYSVVQISTTTHAYIFIRPQSQQYYLCSFGKK